MSDSTLPAPEDCQIPEEVKIAARKGQLAFFVGNGISRLYGVPSWEELCNKMLLALADEKIIDHNKVSLLSKHSLKAKISIAHHYFKNSAGKSKELTYKNILLRNLNEKATAYSSLAKCGAKFITTNYDDLLYQALQGTVGAADPVKNLKIETGGGYPTTPKKTDVETIQFFGDPSSFDRTKLLRNKVVFHLHGSINEEKTIISSTADYLNLYAKESVRDFLSWFFEKNVVVFLGYGLEELELLDLIVRSGGVDKARSFYLLLPLLSHEAEILPQLKIYYDQLKIEIWPFSRDRNDYKAYGDLLENWSGELSRIVQEPMRVDSLDLLDRLMSEVEGGAL